MKADAPPRPKRHRIAIATGVGATVIAAVAVTVAFVMWPRAATPITDDEALRRFEADTAEAAASPVAGGDIAGASQEATGIDRAAPAPADPSVGAGGAADSSGTAGQASGPAAEAPVAAAPVGRPAPGVYSYAAQGSESVQIGPASQDRPLASTVTAAVVEVGSCWRFSLHLFVEHVEDTEFCPSGDGSLEMRSHTKNQRIGAISAEANLTCAPAKVLVAQPAPGAVVSARCPMKTTTPLFEIDAVQQGSTTVVGAENIRVGGTDVPTWHVSIRRTISGDVAGHWHEDLWFSKADHTIVRIDRDARLAGPATFTEHSSFLLTSMQPRT